jgi:exopolyphosphatase/guanosine-5'-triphosphate,3'-diphosphate pyrophosphatase
MRVATIDIGTNTTLLLVAERAESVTSGKRGVGANGPVGPDGGGPPALVALEEHAIITRLGEGVDQTRVLAPAAIARTNAALDRYAEIVRRLGVPPERIAVVGTSAMRDAGGGEAVRAHVAARFGVEARTISGDEEARLTFAGALSGIPADASGRDVVVFDIGGGSTEVVRGDRETRALSYARSFDVGSVRLTERHVRSDPPTEAERSAVLRAAADAFAAVPDAAPHAESARPASPRSAPVGIAGTMTTLAAVSLGMQSYDGARVHGLTLPVSEIERVVGELARVPLDARRRIAGMEPKRADVIVAGGLVALAFLRRVGASAVTISDRGVRWGLAEELAGLVRE